MLYQVKKVSGIFFIALMLLPVMASAKGATKIDMFVGEVKSLGSKPVNRVAVGAGKVIRAEVVSGGELLLIAEGKGSSYLKLWYKDGSRANYNIRVLEQDPDQRVIMQDMIRIKVQMVEVRKSRQSELGIRWADNANGPTFAALGDFKSSDYFGVGAPSIGRRPGFTGLPAKVDPFSTYFGISTAITSQINFMKETGDAITIAEPVLTSINGGSAKFISGGEIPYSTVGANGQSNVEFKEYGIKLDIFPRASDEGDIYTQILAEISQPDTRFTANGAPALLTRRTESQMNVHDGQTIVISGLLSLESASGNASVPGLGEIPVLGNLFKSKNTNHDLRELVIFVTPEVVKAENIAGNSRQKGMQARSREALKKAGDKLQYSVME
jgi:pilus assembly protein CpaC